MATFSFCPRDLDTSLFLPTQPKLWLDFNKALNIWENGVRRAQYLPVVLCINVPGGRVDVSRHIELTNVDTDESW